MSESRDRFINKFQNMKNTKVFFHKNYNESKRNYYRNRNANNDIDDDSKYKNGKINHFGISKRENYKKYENNKAFISYKCLKELKDKNENELIMFFQKYDNISQVFMNTKFSDDMIYLMVNLLARISVLNSSPVSIILNQILENTSFIEKEIKRCLSDININNSDYLNFVLNLINLSDKILDKFSKNNKRIKPGDLLEIEDILHYQIEIKKKIMKIIY